MHTTEKEGKAPAILAYFTFIGTIIAFFMNKDKKNSFAVFHIRQALGLHITFLLLGVLVSPFNSWFVSAPFLIFEIVLLGYGVIGAIQEQRNSVPFLGEYFQKWFNSIG